MDKTRKVYIMESEDFDKSPKYEIKIGEALDRRISTHAVIRPSKIPGIETNLLIIAHHPFGGGLGGWDSYNENLAMVNGQNISNEELLRHANEYAEKLSTKLGYTFFDLDKVKEIQQAQKKVENAKNNLEALIS